MEQFRHSRPWIDRSYAKPRIFCFSFKKVISPEEVWGLAFLICCFIHLQDESSENKDLETHHPKVQIPHYKVDEWKILLVDEKTNDSGWYITTSSEVSSTAISCGHSSLSSASVKQVHTDSLRKAHRSQPQMKNICSAHDVVCILNYTPLQ